MGFTEEQSMAINTDGSNIIVSAGAGSGKTAVLTERVIRKLKDGIDIDRLLILTFTNEAAKEMKGRIRKAVISNNLDRQLNLIDSAYITTFDSYAFSLVKKYHYRINVSPDVKIIDSGIITIYKYKLLDQIFLAKYGQKEFDNLISTFCLKDDGVIKKFILEISNKLNLLTDKEAYLDNYFSNFDNPEHYQGITLEYLALINEKINELKQIYQSFRGYISDNLAQKLDNYFKILFDGKNYDDFVLFKTNIPVRMIGVAEEGLAIKDELKVKISEINELLRFDSLEQLTGSIRINNDNIQVIIDILKILDAEVDNYKDKHGVYEFSDISRMAIKIVRDNIDIREEIKMHFNEIMIDEYQDTSDIQEEFIKYIANNNVYMVGDIKQSIYRFRNANPYIFYQKYDAFSKHNGGIKIDLLKNFRSRKETLASINEIFNSVMDDKLGNANYLKEHNMVYGNTGYDKEDTKHDNAMEIYNYKIDDDDTFSKEEKEIFITAEDIINKINDGYLIFDKNTGKLRKLKYSDICIITDRNKHLNLYRKILEYKGIPSITYMDNELNNDIVFLVFRNLIDLVVHVNNNIFDDKCRYLYASVIRSFLFEYDDDKIYELLSSDKYKSDLAIDMCKNIDMQQPVTQIINEIIKEFQLYSKLVKLNNIDENIIQIENVINIADNLSAIGYNLEDIIMYLYDMEEFSLPIKYSSTVLNVDAVKIMNIHKSKGLEFSLCYFLGMGNKFTIKEISSKFIFSSKYGIILPYEENDSLSMPCLKDLYINNYYQEEISEKIRLLYVALTRAREKMIILTNLDYEKDKYRGLVPYEKRIRYRSFLDILNSIDVIGKYVKEKSAQYTKDYNLIKIKDIDACECDAVIDKRHIKIDYLKEEKKHYSKEKTEIIDLDKLKVMEYGTKVHEIFEYDDFNNPKSKYVKDFLKHVPSDFVNIYREYEFNYQKDNSLYHGIIDLMLEYDKEIYIIDYKLRNTDDVAYLNQLAGYKDYISGISDKKIRTFLYSVMDNEFREV